MAIGPLVTGLPAPAPTAVGTAPKLGAPDFAGLVTQLVSGVEQAEAHANAQVDGMLNKTVDVHDAMIAVQQADLTLQLAVQVRNKFVQAYQEVMRMPI